jgi:predicted transcriptional regulator
MPISKKHSIQAKKDEFHPIEPPRLDLSTKIRKLQQACKIMQQQIVIDFDAVTERQSLDEYNQDIDEALEDFARGNFITAEELKERSKKW